VSHLRPAGALFSNFHPTKHLFFSPSLQPPIHGSTYQEDISQVWAPPSIQLFIIGPFVLLFIKIYVHPSFHPSIQVPLYRSIHLFINRLI
jgi:hypothetical protein